MSFIDWLGLLAAVMLMVGVVTWKKKCLKEMSDEIDRDNAARKKLWDFYERLDQLTPEDKPLFFYNKLQGTWAITTFDRLTGSSAKCVEIATSGGDKLLVNRTASIYADNKEVFNHIMKKVFGHLINDFASYDRPALFLEAEHRLFRSCNDLYVQLDNKPPKGMTRVEVEQSNTRCYVPSEVWEALEKDINQSIQSRTQK